MKIFRYLAGAVFFLWGLCAIATAFVLVQFAPPQVLEAIEKYDGRSGLYISMAVLVALNWCAACQVLWGKGRGFAWWTSIFPALVGLRPSLLSPFLLLPLAYLIAEVTYPYWARQSKPDEQTQRGTASGKGLLLEWMFTIPMVILAGYVFQAVPPVPFPKYVDDGWLVFVAYVWFIIFSHELGHALAGAAVKFELVSLWVCPIEIRRTKTWKVIWNPKLGGHYLGLPRTHENLWRRHGMMVAAGPAANLATFVICWIVLRGANGSIGGAAFGLLHGIMHFSLVSCLVNLAPFKIGAFKTDGRYLWEAFFVPAESRRSLAVLGCLASRSAPVRPRDWPPEWVEALRSGLDDHAAAGLFNLYAQDRLLMAQDDLGALSDMADSALALERLAATAADASVASAYRFQLAWLRCRYDGITDGAAETIPGARKDAHTDPHEILRLQAALAAASGQLAEADSFCEQAEASLLRAPRTGFNLSDLDDLRAFRAGLAQAA